MIPLRISLSQQAKVKIMKVTDVQATCLQNSAYEKRKVHALKRARYLKEANYS